MVVVVVVMVVVVGSGLEGLLCYFHVVRFMDKDKASFSVQESHECNKSVLADVQMCSADRMNKHITFQCLEVVSFRAVSHKGDFPSDKF